MPIVINGSGSITGISAGGLPDGKIQAADLESGVGGKILQVVQALKSDSQSFTSSSSGNDRFDITGLSVSITPASTSNKILIVYNVNAAGPNGGYRAFIHLMRGSTDIYRGDDSNSRTRCSNFIYTRNDAVGHVPSYQNTGTFLDSPSTTSATTLYTVPTATTAIIKSILVSDDSGSGDTITVTITDTSDNVFSLFKTKSISANGTTELLSAPLVLEESEILKVTAATANRLHVVLS